MKLIVALILSLIAAPLLAADIDSAVDDETRLEAHRARDENRQPKTVLAFAASDLNDGARIADLAAGSGYYTAILSRIAGDGGKVYAVDPVRIFENFPNAKKTFPAYLEKDPRANVDYSVQKLDALIFPEPLDLIVMGLYYHDTVWTGVDRAAMNAAMFNVLKPGGRLLVIDHFAAEGADEKVTQDLHRMVPGIVKPEIIAAGFGFVGASDVLRNPDDVLSSSVFAEGVRGKTDRFVYVFERPAD